MISCFWFLSSSCFHKHMVPFRYKTLTSALIGTLCIQAVAVGRTVTVCATLISVYKTNRRYIIE